MRRSKLILGATVAAIGCASGAAQAAHVGVYIGGGVPYYYPVAPVPYYWGPPPPVIVAPPPEAPDYVEQGQAQPAPENYPGNYQGNYQGNNQGNYQQGPADSPGASDNSDTWYYCDASKTYYPYVKQCSSGWRSVPAQPAPSN